MNILEKQKPFLTRELNAHIFQKSSQYEEGDALDVFSRSVMKTICYEASDEFELVAHLEALGYNSYRTKEEFGLDNNFELAAEIFKRTNRKSKPKSFYSPLQDLKKQQLVLLVAIIITMVTFLQVSVNWIIMIWIISWSFIGNSFIASAIREWNNEEVKKVLSATLYLGLLGFLIIALYFRFDVFSATVAIFWWTIAGWTWRKKLSEASILTGLIPSILLLLSMVLPFLFGSVIPWSTINLFAITILAIFFARHELTWPKITTLRWMLKNSPNALLLGFYGLGQGLLLMQLVKLTGALGLYWNILGLALCTLLIMMAERLVIWFKQTIAELMWSDDLRSRKHYRNFVEVIVLRYSALPTLALIIVVLFASYDGYNDINKYIPIIGFVLLGIALSFALALNSLNDTHFAYVSFGLTGLAAALGTVPSLLLMMLTLLLFIRLITYTKQIERYSTHLL